MESRRFQHSTHLKILILIDMADQLPKTVTPRVFVAPYSTPSSKNFSPEDAEPERNTPFSDRARMIGLARQNGVIAYIGDGSAPWPTVHRLDAAVLLRLALEKGTALATYDAVAEQGIPINMSELFHAIGSDNPTSSELGWHPTQPELLVDVEADYFSKYST